MEPLAWVEVLGRDGDVASRHPVYRWPAVCGRGYDADVILDDPFIAPRHLSIEPAEDGRYRLADLGSVNGIAVMPADRRVTAAEVGPDDVARVGRTPLRIRAPSYAVRPELPLRAAALHRRPLGFAFAAGLLLALTGWNAWITTVNREESWFLVVPMLAVCAGIAVWISVWSLVGRTVSGRANFAAHGVVICGALAAIACSDALFDYLSFGFDASWLDHAGTAAAGAIFAYMIYRHLRLNSRASRRSLGLVAAGVSLAAYGVIAGLELANESTREGMQRYDEAIKAPPFLWVQGATPESFLAVAGKLKSRVDAAARLEPEAAAEPRKGGTGG